MSGQAARLGFTLAEVLVTLGIIGVVSALTVPALVQNYQKKSYVTQLHKVYNQLNQALLQYQNDRNALNLKEAGFINQVGARALIENYFKIVNNCGENKEPCFANLSEYRKIQGDSVGHWYAPRNYYTLADGSSLGIAYHLIGQVLAEVVIDTNGSKGPNIVGRDCFFVYIYNNGIVDDAINFYVSSEQSAPVDKDTREQEFNSACLSSNPDLYHGCFGKILNDNWEMTY